MFSRLIIREALVEIISNHEEEHEDTTATIIGKVYGGGGYSSSSSSDYGDNVNVDEADKPDGDDDDSSSSTSSVSSQEAIDKNEHVPVVTQQQQQQQHSQVIKVRGGGNKKKNKKSKNDMTTKMGKAPSLLLPYHPQDNNTKSDDDIDKRVLEVPNVLLPNNYLRDNYPFHVPSVAKRLLSTWDQLMSNTTNPPTILVVLLQSGRFAAAVFTLDYNNKSTTNSSSSSIQMIAHKTSTRYTVRKGQGGAQSSHDQSKSKAKSVGSQLRREGEKQLRNDVHETWNEWKQLGYVDTAMWVYVSCPKGMKRDYLFTESSSGSGLLEKNDERWRNIPLDVGRPTLEATSVVLDCVLSCSVRDMTDEEMLGEAVNDEMQQSSEKNSASVKLDEKKVDSTPAEPGNREIYAPPFTPLHDAVVDGDLTKLMELLQLLEESEQQDTSDTNNTKNQSTTSVLIDYDVNTTGGIDNQTALHVASVSTHPNAASIINALLIQGHANPCAVDARGRPPYSLATSDKHRETFRLVRGTLGEDYCAWDESAKVGPPLSEDDVQLKKQKALEKKRRQRARQKEKKASEKAAAEEAAAKERAELEKKKQEEDAKRIRDGLKPKTTKASNSCDFCQKIVKGKRRAQMFQRLDYAYCSTDCVKKHQRELMAAAAAARMGA